MNFGQIGVMKLIKLMFDFLFQIKMITQVVLLHHDMFLICFFATEYQSWMACEHEVILITYDHVCMFYWYISNRGHCVD